MGRRRTSRNHLGIGALPLAAVLVLSACGDDEPLRAGTQVG